MAEDYWPKLPEGIPGGGPSGGLGGSAMGGAGVGPGGGGDQVKNSYSGIFTINKSAGKVIG